MSNALLEAMAAGKPIVATDVGGNSENLAAGKAGILVPAGDPKALRQAIVELIENKNKRAELGKRAQKIARQQYSLAAMIERTENIYREILSS
jgi:glycosyltransferase involved in cell wall biosynthesis